MASWVLSECGIRPLPQSFPRPRTGFISAKNTNPSKIRFLHSKTKSTDLKFPAICSPPGFSRDRNWALKVSAPFKVPSLDADERGERIDVFQGVESEGEFDPGAPPPFKLADIRAAIPKHCWVKDPWRSMSYVVRDVAVVLGLAAAAAYLNNWLVWPLYWAAQGTMFWALFVLGHDCGHGSFSNNPKLNSVVGHILHSSILVPYHGWRISHRTHHQNHGHVENDESWHPLPEKIFKSLDTVTRMLRFTVPFPMLAYPFYLPISKEWSVEAMPTFIFLKERNLVDKVVGAKKEDLQQTIAKHAGLTILFVRLRISLLDWTNMIPLSKLRVDGVIVME